MFSVDTKKNNAPEMASGFTLVELMVTIGIMLLITGMVVTKYSSFNSTVILKSQAYELALDIRGAQVYGVSAGGTTHSYREAFGIYIDLSTPNKYILFQDQTKNGFNPYKYDADASGSEQVGEAYTIDPRFSITKICTTRGVSPSCSDTKASIAFKRPNFDAVMWSTGNTIADKMEITISSINNTAVSRTVVVYASGQISVQ